MVFWAGCPDQGPVIVTEHARALGARAGMAPVFPSQDTLTPRPAQPCHAQAPTGVQGSLQPSPANTVQWLLLADRWATSGWGLRGVLGRACITKERGMDSWEAVLGGHEAPQPRTCMSWSPWSSLAKHRF